MTTREQKQIRVYVDVDQWSILKADDGQTDTDTLKRLLTELEQLRRCVDQLAVQDIGQISTMVAALSEIHTNPLIALGMCLERYRQFDVGPVLKSEDENSLVTTSTVDTDDFVDNSGDF